MGSKSGIGKMSLIRALVVQSTFLLNWIEDFCKLGTYPNMLQKSFKMVLIVMAS